MIRFDTNGIIFGTDDYCRLFYSELFKLFESGKLNNIHIQIDYSFKGATSKEFFWSQSQQLPTNLSNNDKDIELKNHPQVQGYKNIVYNISKFTEQNPGFRDCVSITVEKGIDHDWKKSKLWLYYPNSMNWEELANKLNLEFSDVVNCFDLNFGWNLNAKINRYTKRGAMIELSNGPEKVNVNSNPVLELMEFRRQNLESKDYMTIVYPTGKKIELFKQKRDKQIKLPEISKSDKNYWIITGPESNLKIGVDNNLWGTKEDLKDLWNSLKNDDLIFFYCSYPISGIIGYGKAIGKEIDTKPFWPNENSQKESKYPLRIKFEKTFILPIEEWAKNRVSITGLGINYYHGLNFVSDNSSREKLMNRIYKKFNIKN